MSLASRTRIRVFCVTLKNSLGVATAKQYADNFNRVCDHVVENDVAAERKNFAYPEPILRGGTPNWLTAQHLQHFVAFVDKRVCVCHTVISNVALISIKFALARGLTRNWDLISHSSLTSSGERHV